MATLYKHGSVQADYTRYIAQSNGIRIGYIFRLMSNGNVLIRSALPGKRWRIFKRHENTLQNIAATIDPFLRDQVANIFG